MNPFGIFQLALVASEGVAEAVNPKLRTDGRKRAVWFGLIYVGIILVGLVIIVMVVRSLYFGR